MTRLLTIQLFGGPLDGRTFSFSVEALRKRDPLYVESVGVDDDFSTVVRSEYRPRDAEWFVYDHHFTERRLVH